MAQVPGEAGDMIRARERDDRDLTSQGFDLVNVVPRARRTAFRAVASRLSEMGSLDPALSLDDAVGLLWVLTAPHMYEFLVVELGWSLERYRGHIVRLIRRALLKSEHDPG